MLTNTHGAASPSLSLPCRFPSLNLKSATEGGIPRSPRPEFTGNAGWFTGIGDLSTEPSRHNLEVTMKMVRSLLLGSAAGFVAVAGAQAADMPVKAKPVEYVKICTLYGAGFYYLPGTDICVKHGAYVRAQYYYGFGANLTNGPMVGAAGQNTIFKDLPNDTVFRARFVYTLDARTQTEYGTLRAYALIGATTDSPQNEIAGNAAALYATRGFIQFAGFTLGRASSFYDIFSNAANSYFALWSSDTGDSGQNVAAYTFQFGNGFSATISAEDPRRAGVVNT